MTSTIPKDSASKALYAAIGAPVVTGRKIKDLGSRLASDYASTVDEWADAGRRLTGQVKESKVVEQVQNRVDVEQLQVQVEKLRDQLESVLSNWREQFVPATKSAPPEPVRVEDEPAEAATGEPAVKSATKKPAAKAETKKPAAKLTPKKDSPAS